MLLIRNHLPIHGTLFHFLELFSKVVLGTVDIIIKHSIHIEKSPVLVLFCRYEFADVLLLQGELQDGMKQMCNF